MKNKSQHTTHKNRKKSSLEKLSTYIDKEVTLIHENLEELKIFLKEHASESCKNGVHGLDGDIADYYASADDLFHQISLETGQEPPLKAKFYETLLLKKKKGKGSTLHQSDST